MRLAIAVITVLALSISACSGDSDDGPDDSSTQSSKGESGNIIQPGRPGEPNKTLGPDASVDPAQWNDADAMFVQMMIPHHAQALEMCDLARTRASDRRVIELAQRIKAAQGPEIVQMSSWLQSRDLPVPESMDTESMDDMGGHMDMGGHQMMMPGMLSDAELRELKEASGARFDQLFVSKMIKHHQGAVTAAKDELTDGADLMALEFANDVAATQGAEIDRMQDLFN